jgi:hypothetical protein
MIEDAAHQAAGSGVMPREFLLGIMRDEAQPLALRLDAAKAAAPYLHPKLVAQRVVAENETMTHDDWVKLVLEQEEVSPNGACQGA